MRGTPVREPVVDLNSVAAVIFDIDGVVTDTARVHAAAWKRTFDFYLRQRAKTADVRFSPFDVHSDYLTYVDGKSRLDGVRDFLASRGITLPEGRPSDGPDAQTVHGLGAHKDAYFLECLRRDGVAPYHSSLAFISDLKKRGVLVAAVSASRNCAEVLRAAGLSSIFDARVDGIDAAALKVPGKPDPAIFLEAARRLRVAPARAAVVEDALAGVEAGRAGGFAMVVGINRDGQEPRLYDHGADVVVSGLSELRLVGRAA